MATIISDTLKNTTWSDSYDLQNGYIFRECRRGIVVGGLDTTRAAASRQADAIAACGVSLLSAHPDSSTAAFCTKRYANSMPADDVVEVICEYRTPPMPSGGGEVMEEWTGTFQSDTTTRGDLWGAGGGLQELVVPWYRNGDHATVPATITAQAQTIVPAGTYRRILYLHGSGVLATMNGYFANFHGRINDADWNGGPKWGWLCSFSSQRMGPLSYRVVFEMTLKMNQDMSGGWVANCGYTSPETYGNLPGNFKKGTNAATSNGYLKAVTIRTADFSTLPFTPGS